MELNAQKGAQIAHPSGGKQPHDKGYSAAERDLGIKRDDARRAEKVASLSDEAKEAAREVGLDASQIETHRKACFTGKPQNSRHWRESYRL